MSHLKTARKRTHGIWLPESEAAIELALALKREGLVELSSDARLIGMCTSCGYLGYVEEIPSAPQRHLRVLVCEECRAVERKPARSEIELVRRKAGAA